MKKQEFFNLGLPKWPALLVTGKAVTEDQAMEILIRTSTNYLRTCVYKRDKGICKICNIDTKDIAKHALSLEGQEREEYLKFYSISNKRKIWMKKHGGGLWDADHIVPVKEGGGLCGLDNLRTLCIKCHKEVTKVLASKKNN
jgi:5-methylcytosine-specific restriction endonuclease McrA